MSKLICVTGGAGYIGSHICVELLNSGYNVVVIDNLVNSSSESLRRVEALTGRTVTFLLVDLLDAAAVDAAFAAHRFDAVIHMAGLKAVGESVAKPLEYYNNNIVGTLHLLYSMRKHHCKHIVFSSSATVYGVPKTLPIDEQHPLGPTNPYGRTKLQIEEILRDVQSADKEWRVIILRYFNPVGAHPSGKIGEDPAGIPNNLMPFVAQAAVGRRDKVTVFGRDYNTPDGTGVRDYLHVVDLAKGHLCALSRLDNPACTFNIYNLGTGRGYSVLEMIAAFEKACGHTIPTVFGDRRAGDVDTMFADATLAKKELGWVAKHNLEEMCNDQWRWQSENPQGFNKKSN